MLDFLKRMFNGWTCPNCGYYNGKDVVYCKKCSRKR